MDKGFCQGQDVGNEADPFPSRFNEVGEEKTPVLTSLDFLRGKVLN
jgi:hypothetical protein